VSNEGYPASLEARNLYLVVADPEAEREGMLRVIDESGADYLYPSDRFAAVELPAAVLRALSTAVQERSPRRCTRTTGPCTRHTSLANRSQTRLR
jgi:hypothetical protein